MQAIWDDGLRIKREADAKVKAVHFDRGDHGWAMLEEGPDGTPRLPKVPLSDDWLVYKNYVDFQVEPSKATFRNSLCTPYMYTKYACIFGLTGSVGGEAERAYIEKTYQAVPYEVPQFLHTCVNTTKDEAKMLGCSIQPSTAAMIKLVVELAVKWHTEVPVLIITRGAEHDELVSVVAGLVAAMQGEDHSGGPMSAGDESKLRSLVRLGQASSEKRQLGQALSSRSRQAPGGGASAIAAAVNAARSGAAGGASRKSRHGHGAVASVHPRIQLLQARNAEGESMIAHANDIIEQATKQP